MDRILIFFTPSTYIASINFSLHLRCSLKVQLSASIALSFTFMFLFTPIYYKASEAIPDRKALFIREPKEYNYFQSFECGKVLYQPPDKPQ